MRSAVQYSVCFFLILFALCGAATSTQNALDLYQQALIQLRSAGNLEEAARLFEAAAKAAGEDRALAAKALVGAAESYEKMGQARAYTTYQEVARSYADQRDQVTIARARLAQLSKSAVRWNFEGDVTGSVPLGWAYGAFGGPGVRPIKPLVVEDKGCFEGLHCVFIPAVEHPPKNWWETLTKPGTRIDAYLNQKVRFRAAIRVEGGHAALWMRVDRTTPDGKLTDSPFFNNMNKSPITSGKWNYYALVGMVPADSTQIYFGVLTYENTKVWVDDVSFEIADPSEPLSENFPIKKIP